MSNYKYRIKEEKYNSGSKFYPEYSQSGEVWVPVGLVGSTTNELVKTDAPYWSYNYDQAMNVLREFQMYQNDLTPEIIIHEIK